MNAPAKLTHIEDFQRELNLKLPNDYVQFILVANGFSLMSVEVYGVGNDLGEKSINALYQYEHNEVYNPMYRTLIPFSPDGYGNHYCFDTSSMSDENCDIVFWQYDVSYSNDFPPEKTNSSFLDWVQEVVIDWTKEYYNNEGNEK